jgi:hypothetical protein
MAKNVKKEKKAAKDKPAETSPPAKREFQPNPEIEVAGWLRKTPKGGFVVKLSKEQLDKARSFDNKSLGEAIQLFGSGASLERLVNGENEAVAVNVRVPK